MKKVLICFCASVLFLHCEKKKEVQSNMKSENSVSDSVAVIQDSIHEATKLDSVQLNFMAVNETEKVLQKIEARKNQVISELKSATPQQASQLYLKLKKDNQPDIDKLSELESKILETYYEYWEKTKPQNITETEILLGKYEMEFWEIGEGITEIRFLPDYYQKIFKSKLTPDFSEFVNLLARDDQELFQADAAISVPRSEVQTRMLNWENFVKKYPKSELLDEAFGQYQFYLYAFLLGFDNTPTLAYQTGELSPEHLKEFQTFLKKYPNTKAAEAVRILLQHKTSTPEERRNFLKPYLDEEKIKW